MNALRKAIRYARLYYVFVHNCLRREMEFNFNFLSFITADLFSIGTAMLFFTIVYSKVKTVGGWTRDEALFFLGTFYLIDALNMMVWMHNAYRFPEYVRRGELDLVLAKPVDAQFYVMTCYFHLGHIGQVIGALILMAYSWSHLGIGISLFLLILCAMLCFNGSLVLGVTLFIIAEPCLWMVRSGGLMALDSLFHFTLKPEGIYGRVLRFVLSAMVPMAVVASFPPRLVLGRISWQEVVWPFVATGITIMASRVLWRYGIKRYESASS